MFGSDGSVPSEWLLIASLGALKDLVAPLRDDLPAALRCLAFPIGESRKRGLEHGGHVFRRNLEPNKKSASDLCHLCKSLPSKSTQVA